MIQSRLLLTGFEALAGYLAVDQTGYASGPPSHGDGYGQASIPEYAKASRITMIIIFGTKVRYKTIATGQFYCPQCKTKRDYERRKARNYFALYFIPIIPLGDAGEFVTCLTCGTNFQPDVLSIPVPANTPLERFVREAQADLDSGTPIEMAQQKLINTGLNRDLVDQVIAQAAGPDRKRCPVDNLTYRSSVQRCAQCGAALEIPPQA